MILGISARWRLIFRSEIVAGLVWSTAIWSWAQSPNKLLPPLKPVEIHVNPEIGYAPDPEESSTMSPWVRGSEVNILADQSSLEDILQEFGNQMNVRVFSSPGVRGKISGRFLGLKPEKFLDQLSRAYGLDWLYYNQTIYFYSSSESLTIVRTLRYLPGEQAIKVIEGMGIFSVGASIRGIPGTPMVILSGPPKFLEIAQEVLRTLEEQTAYKQISELVIQVFPLNYAWAYDVQLSGGTSIEGVATTLSRLVSGGDSGGGGFGVNLGNFSPSATALSGASDRGGAQQRVARAFPPQDSRGSSSSPNNATAAQGTNRAPQSDTGNNGAYGPSLSASQNSVSIVADVRANAVIIRDVRENMPFYKAAIAKLDVPVRIVEISAAIVDIDVNASRTMGFSGIRLKALAGLGAEASTGGAINGNFSISGVYGTNTITAALNFLEQNQKAKVLSRPTIVTLDNYAAVISTKETFYAKTEGQYNSDLYDVSTGQVLEVAPHITIDRGKPELYMQLKLTDGSVDNSNQVNGLPTVKQSNVITQAVIRKDQSLLIGGLYRKVDARDRSGYPWLNKVPILNFFFSSSKKQNLVVERLFLITPRVVDIYSKNLGDYRQYFQPSPGVEEAGQKARDGQMQSVVMPQASPTPIPRSRGRR